IAVVFLDTQFRIRRFTPAVRELLDLIPADIGRPLTDLARKFTDPALLDDAKTVLERLIPIEREVEATDGRTFVRRVLPYRTTDNRIAGVVLTFVDVTRLRAAELAGGRSKEEFNTVVAGIEGQAVILTDADGRITAWNVGAERVLGYTAAAVIGQQVDRLFSTADREAGLPARERTRAAAEGQVSADRLYLRQDGSTVAAHATLSALFDARKLRGFVMLLLPSPSGV
ncbi:MAG TPA: PAS domain-containing protein, partial [Phycisphaerales bacterium]|nr:PAS domain-containing protein [Phycisphaerales bacterium]